MIKLSVKGFLILFITLQSLVGFSQKTISILAIGTSITYGIGSSDGTGYRKVLYEKLLMKQFDVKMLGSVEAGKFLQPKCEAYPGKVISFLQDSVLPKASNLKPDYVLLEVGVNDMSFPVDPEHAPFRLSNLLDKISSTYPEAKILLASLTPIWTNRLLEYNKSLPGIIDLKRKQGIKLYLCDMFNAGIGINEVPDAIHPNDAGFAKMANVWASAILSLEAADRKPGIVSDLSANAGPGQVILRWNSSFQSLGYKVKRSLSATGEFKDLAIVKTDYWFVDTSAKNNSTYYYSISGYNGEGESQLSAIVNATPLENLGIAINCGGHKSAGFLEDFGFEGGERANWYWDKINLKNVAHPNGIFVFKTARQGRFTYKIQKFDPSKYYTVKLHFVEGTFNQPEKRVFDVEVNNVKKLSNFDIFEKTRTKNLAHTEQFYLKPNAKGEFNIQFISQVGDAIVSGIEVIP